MPRLPVTGPRPANRANWPKHTLEPGQCALAIAVCREWEGAASVDAAEEQAGDGVGPVCVTPYDLCEVPSLR